MTDRIVFQKLGFVFAPAQKISPLKREGQDSGKRRFGRQLAEENEKNQEDTIELDAKIESMPEEDGLLGNGSLRDSREEEGPGNGGDVHGSDLPGSVVDIHV